MSELQDDVAIVTGGAIGIGRAICLELARRGAAVVVIDRTAPAQTVAELEASGARALGIAADVTQESDMSEAAQRALSAFGRIDVLVNNAGLFASLAQRPFAEIPIAEWRSVFEVNVLGTAIAARSVLPAMRERGGSIVNIASTTAFKGSGLPHYAASKGAVLALTRNLARELGSSGIRVNSVSPGFTVSTGVEQHPDEVAGMRAHAADSRSLRREMVPDDIVGAVAFLAGPSSSFITGQTLVVDGGAYFH